MTWDWPRAIRFLVLYGIVVTIAVVVLDRIAPAEFALDLTNVFFSPILPKVFTDIRAALEL